jgi:hypothetical protein
MPTIQQIPRTTVRLGVAAARLPLTAAEAVLSGGHDDWPPTLVFEGLEAQVKLVAGSVLHDGVLSEEGRLLQAKVARLREAADLEGEAERTRQEADAELAARTREAARTEERAAEAERERKARIAAEGAEATRRAEADARRAEQDAAEAEDRAEQAGDRQARRSRAQALSAEEKALAKEKAAASRARAARTAGAKVQATKAARKRTR